MPDAEPRGREIAVHHLDALADSDDLPRRGDLRAHGGCHPSGALSGHGTLPGDKAVPQRAGADDPVSGDWGIDNSVDIVC